VIDDLAQMPNPMPVAADTIPPSSARVTTTYYNVIRYAWRKAPRRITLRGSRCSGPNPCDDS
jgi:hypothetical protein